MTQQERIEQAVDDFLQDPVFSKLLNRNAAIALAKHICKFVLSNQWISVEEESPKESGTCFIKTKIGYGIAIYNCNGGWFDIDGKPFTKITHWMEKPPTEGGE